MARGIFYDDTLFEKDDNIESNLKPGSDRQPERKRKYCQVAIYEISALKRTHCL